MARHTAPHRPLHGVGASGMELKAFGELDHGAESAPSTLEGAVGRFKRWRSGRVGRKEQAGGGGGGDMGDVQLTELEPVLPGADGGSRMSCCGTACTARLFSLELRC